MAKDEKNRKRTKTLLWVLLLFLLLSLSALLISCSFWSDEPDVAEWVELHYYIDEEGNAQAFAKVWLEGARSYVFEEVLRELPREQLAQDVIADITASLAEYGIEVRNAQVDFSGTNPGESFSYTVTWKTPALARWTHDHWEIRSQWLDSASSAARLLASLKDLQMGLRVLSREKKFSSFSYALKQAIRIHLPKGAENVRLSVPQESSRLDLGERYGYIENNLSINADEARIVIVEDITFAISTETRIAGTLSPERITKAFPSGNYTVRYNLPAPATRDWLDSLTQVRLELKYSPEPITEFTLWHLGEEYSFSAAELLYIVACGLASVERGNAPAFELPTESVTLADSEIGDFKAFNREMPMREYLQLAKDVCDKGQRDRSMPGSVATSFGRLRMRDLLYTFIRLLSFYNEHEHLPRAILVMPVPSGTLISGQGEIPAKYAYFLLPSAYVVTESPRVKRILNYIDLELLRNGRTLDASRRISKLRTWVSDHLTYRKPPRPKRDSEEVLKDGYGDCKDYTNVFLALARSEGIPSRWVQGWIIPKSSARTACQDRKATVGHAWAQVYLPAQGWVPVDPQVKTGGVPYRICANMEETWQQALAAYEALEGTL